MSTDVKTIPQGTNGHSEVSTNEQRTAANGVKLPVYMDNHATTPMDPGCWKRCFPSSWRSLATPPAATTRSGGRARKASKPHVSAWPN